MYVHIDIDNNYFKDTNAMAGGEQIFYCTVQSAHKHQFYFSINVHAHTDTHTFLRSKNNLILVYNDTLYFILVRALCMCI